MKAVGLAKTDRQRQEKAMAQLVERLNINIAATTTQLLKLHQLDPGVRSQGQCARARELLDPRPGRQGAGGLAWRGGVGRGDRAVGRPDGGRHDLRRRRHAGRHRRRADDGRRRVGLQHQHRPQPHDDAVRRRLPAVADGDQRAALPRGRALRTRARQFRRKRSAAVLAGRSRTGGGAACRPAELVASAARGRQTVQPRASVSAQWC